MHQEDLKCASTLKFDNITDIKSVDNTKKKLLVFIPLGIPGMGKSTFVDIIQPILGANHYDFKVISSDELRDKVINEYIRRFNNKPSREEAFEKTQKNFAKTWNDEVTQLVKSFQSQHNALFLDKNHPHNAIHPTISNINASNFKDMHIE